MSPKVTNGTSHHERPTFETSPSTPIAIVGMSCKFAGNVSNPWELWDHLASGRDGWSPIPEERFNAASLYHPDQQRTDRHHVEGGYFLDADIEAFDAPFFSLSAEAASAMDPQLRQSMEGVYEALENAGIPIEKFAGSNTSVFSGTFGRDWTDRLTKDPETLPASFFIGNGAAMYSNRISHFFDLKGPSVTVDTGCSGSMAALHMAAQTIRSGESDMSIVVTAQFILNSDLVIALSNLGVLSPSGRSYSWDHRANGYGRGEGMAVVVLKRLSNALQDGDHVHAVIRETWMNQDGKTSTITSPSMEAQQRLIEECYAHAGMKLSETAYVEAHMTGTPTGDPVEAEVLAKTFGASRAPGNAVYVGSVKPNVGHTEPVSGLASIIKTALVLQKQLIPPHINFEKPNPAIRLSEWNLRVPTGLTEWPRGMPLQASVNNFGYGGTNVHVIMEASPDQTNADGSLRISGTDPKEQRLGSVTRPYVYLISSKHAAGVLEMNRRLAAYIRDSIDQNQAPAPIDLAYTLSERRSRFSWVAAVSATDLEQLASLLEDSHSKASRAPQNPPRIGFIFNGQGAQWPTMGRDLIESYPIFKTSLELADRVLQLRYGMSWSLQEGLLRDERTSRIHDANVSQVANVALQLCLVDLLKSWNITPGAVVSHSSGEVAAAYAAGMLSFEEALGVVYYRGQLAAKHSRQGTLSGGMIAARLSASEAVEYIGNLSSGKVVVACVNSPSSITLSGDANALDEVVSRLEDDAVFYRRLRVPLAYHSHHMKHMAQEYENILESILPSAGRDPQILFASPVTGDLIVTGEMLRPRHWVENLVSPVLFSEALKKMVFSSSVTGVGSTNVDVLVEIGAHNTLSSAVRDTLGSRNLPYFSCLKRYTSSVSNMQDVACGLLARGYPVSLGQVNQLPDCGLICVHDLPSYVWDHSSRFSVEPRPSRQNRYRLFPPHELLGSSVPGASSLTPTWRNFLRLQDIPWLVDHRIESNVVFPGAGYVSMAIEAVRLLKSPTGSDHHIYGYRIRDLVVTNALMIPYDPLGVEIIFTLRGCNEMDLDHRDWYEFELCSVTSDDSWTRHCKGYVKAEVGAPMKAFTSDNSRYSSAIEFFTGSAEVRHVDPDVTFATMRKMGIYHGPTFQNLINSQVVGSNSVTDFSQSPAAAEGFDYVLHPTTLDSVFQTCYFSLPPEAAKGTMALPRSIGAMFIPGKGERDWRGTRQSFVELLKWSKRDVAFNISVSCGTNGEQSSDEPFRMTNFRLQRITQSEENTQKIPRLHSQCRWEPDILDSSPAQVTAYTQIWLDHDELALEKRFREAAYHLMVNALSELENGNPDEWQPYLRRLHAWMQKVVESVEHGQLAHSDELGCAAWHGRSKLAIQTLLDHLAAENVGGQLLCKIGHQLGGIIRGSTHPLELMMEDGLLQRFYMELPQFINNYNQLAKFVELYAVKEPGARVLEVGAGTGGATAHVLQAFATRAESGRSGTLLGHYDFTDVSADFFPAAMDRFSALGDKMRFSKLDIEVDPVQQGFRPGEHDLIVASLVLHATRNLEQTLANVRKLLRAGGKLVLLEGTRHSIDLELIFGTLPGWWLGEEPERQMSAIADVETWDKCLKATGFSGVDAQVNNCEQPVAQVGSVMVSTAVAVPSYPAAVCILADDAAPKGWLEQLATSIHERTGTTPAQQTLKNVEPDRDTLYLVTIEMQRALVANMDRAEFEKLRRLLVDAMGVFWISCGGAMSGHKPLFAATQGLLRTMRREDGTKRYVHLDLDAAAPDPWTTESINHIMHVFGQSLDYNMVDGDKEWEYAVQESILHVPRLYPDVALDVACSGLTPPAEPQGWHSHDRHVVYQVPTGAEGFLRDEVSFQEVVDFDAVPDGMVEVETRAFGLNFQDIMIAMGLVQDVALLTHEASGVVKRLGPGTEQSGLKVGDRICGAFRGGFASRSRAWWTNIIRVPDGMTWEEAASFPIAFLTAHIGLLHIARLKQGERVLIHSATGGVGQAAIMLANHVGAEVFATCGTQSKRRFLMERYKIPANRIWSSRDTSFASGIMAETGGHGVDVALNSLAGPLLKASWQCMASFGRFIEIGKVDLHAGRHLDMTLFSHNVVMAGLDLVQYSEMRGTVIRDALVDLVGLYHSGDIQVVDPIKTFSISDMGKAMSLMQTGVHMGKLVMVAEPKDAINVVPRAIPLRLADMNITHLVVGGLTGVGHAIALWMIENGVRNMLTTSRNAVSHPGALVLEQLARERGCRLVIRDCDITDEKALLELLGVVKTLNMPPVGGVIQAAMVLDDSVFERMTYDQWQKAICPKVAGTFNLHNHLANLEYFVMLSSGTAITGNVSQANYAAGNSFQDALARHRAANGQPAISINLGPVEDVGYVAEQGEEVRKRVNEGVTSINIPISNIMSLVERAITNPLTKDADHSQIITCFPSHELLPQDQDFKDDKRFGTLRLGNEGVVADNSGDGLLASHVRDLTRELAITGQSIKKHEAVALVVKLLAAEIGELFSMDPADIDVDMPLTHHGVDSLVAVRFRNWLNTEVKARVTIFEILQSHSLTKFAALVAERSNFLVKS